MARGMIRLPLLLLALAAAGCGGAARNDAPAEPRSPRTTDQLCLNDCLGSGATRSFCEDRCNN
jgi:hypothetical protein